MPVFSVVERDYTAIADKLAAVGPLADKLGFTVKNVTYKLAGALDRLSRSNGVMLGGAADGRPAIDTDAKMAEAILAFSGTTNGAPLRPGLQGPGNPYREETRGPVRGFEEKFITFARPRRGRSR